MTAKRMIITVIAAYAVIWVTDYLIHEIAMKADYLATKHLWRTPEETMRNLFRWILVGELMAGTALTVIWVRGFAATAKPTCALAFGATAGLLATAYAPIMHSVMPLPGLLCVKWVLFGDLQCIFVSLVLYALTRPATTA